VETDGLRACGLHEGAFREQAEKTTPLGRIAQPGDIALEPRSWPQMILVGSRDKLLLPLGLYPDPTGLTIPSKGR
jgi:hypothetical protein